VQSQGGSGNDSERRGDAKGNNRIQNTETLPYRQPLTLRGPKVSREIPGKGKNEGAVAVLIETGKKEKEVGLTTCRLLRTAEKKQKGGIINPRGN